MPSFSPSHLFCRQVEKPAVKRSILHLHTPITKEAARAKGAVRDENEEKALFCSFYEVVLCLRKTYTYMCVYISDWQFCLSVTEYNEVLEIPYCF